MAQYIKSVILNLITALGRCQDLSAFSASTSSGKHVENHTTQSFAFLISHHFMYALFEDRLQSY